MNKVEIRDLSDLQLKSIRDGFGEGLLMNAEKNPDIVALSADLTESVRMHWFADKYKERFFQTGICEQNMAGVAAGMALSGKIPFIGSFANFSPGRNYDQIRTSICMMNANVKIASSHAGFSYGEDGISVQMLEDIAMMRALPNMTVIVPADAYQASQAVSASLAVDGPVYLRLGRAESPLIFADNSEFILGQAQLLREGLDVLIISTGYLVFRSLLAADYLHKQGVEAAVMNIHTIKPLDESAILSYASKTCAVVVAEEAQMYGGLGGAVAELFAKKLPLPIEMVSVADRFGESATSLELHKKHNLMEDDIVSAANRAIARKVNCP